MGFQRMLEPPKVYVEAKKREKENIRFRTFLKNRAIPDELDQHFLALHNALFTNFDCCKCANCCRSYSTSLEESEVDSIATFLGLSKRNFTEEYLALSIEGYELKAPCRFLKKNGECEIQACKPATCKGFPHTDKPGRLESLLGILSFAKICPVVFEMLERLKVIYRFRTGR